MTDLSTANIQRLLDQATPGPWHVWDAYEDEDYRPDTALQLHGAEGEYLGLMHCQNPYLAALAPELAAEVLRMRREMSGLYNELARTATDCSISDHPGGKFSARVAQAAAQRVFRVLLEGDQDG